MKRWLVLLIIGYAFAAGGAFAVQHNIGSHTLIIEGKDSNFFFWRSQGISLSISPTRPWWCLWLCTTGTKNAEILRGAAELSGLQSNTAQNTCSNCGELDVMGPVFGGVNVPRPYSRADYSVSIRIDGTNHEVSGAILY